MKITEIVSTARPTISLEVFPPKDVAGWESLKKNLKILSKFHPAFISVTYGAGGKNRRENLTLLKMIKQEMGLEVLAHLTCVGQTREEISEIIQQLQENKIENVLALRGDLPSGQKNHGDFQHATDLMEFIRQIDETFCVGVAVYPEKHPESLDWAAELKYLKRKVDLGASFGISQMFFDNQIFQKFLQRLKDNHVTLPVIAGIMPLMSEKQIKKITALCRATIPENLLDKIVNAPDEETAREVGTRFAIQQCQELLAEGIKHLHFYTLNQSASVSRIIPHLDLL